MSTLAHRRGNAAVPHVETSASFDRTPLEGRLASGESDVDSGRISPLSRQSSYSLPAFRFSWRELWRWAGPGFLMSLAYIDPGNLESDLQQGAYTGGTLIWITWWSTVLGFLLQEMSARIGLATGCDLAQLVRQHYPRWLSISVYVMMEIAVIGADIQEVIGTAVGLRLLFGLQLWVGCLITVADTFTFMLVQRLGARYFEAVICSMIFVVAACLIANALQAGAEPSELFDGWLRPQLLPWAGELADATLGAVIQPHNLYLHSALVLARNLKPNEKQLRPDDAAIRDSLWCAPPRRHRRRFLPPSQLLSS